jgi:hypothetical protein
MAVVVSVMRRGLHAMGGLLLEVEDFVKKYFLVWVAAGGWLGGAEAFLGSFGGAAGLAESAIAGLAVVVFRVGFSACRSLGRGWWWSLVGL